MSQGEGAISSRADPLDVRFFADAFRDSPVASVIIGADGKVLLWNTAAEGMFGWRESEVIGNPLPFIPPERLEEHRGMRRQDLEGQCFTARHITRVRKDGSPVDLSVSTAPIRGASGGVAGIISIYSDVGAEKRAEANLRLREELANKQVEELQRFYSTAPIGLGFLDTDLRYVRVNERLARINGIPVAAHIGRRLNEIVPEFAREIESACRDVIASGIAVIEREVRAATYALPGIARDWLVSFHPLKGPDGSALGVTTVVTDVTERKRLTDQLRRQEAQLRLVIDAMPGLVAYVDREYHYLFTNRGYSEWFHLDRSELQGRAIAEVIGEEFFGNIRPHLDRALQGEVVLYETKAPKQDNVRDVHVTYVPDRAPDGSVRGLVVVARDITETKRAGEALRESEERFRRIVEIAAEGIWIVDPAGKTTFVNGRMADLLGCTPEEMTGRPFSDFLDPEEHVRGNHGFDSRKQGDSAPREYRFARAGGGAIWLDITATPMRDAGGALTGVLAMCTDVTERKRGEQQLRQTQKLESLGILAGGIAHDFNNLLVGIMGNASLALDALGDSPSRTMLQDVISASERAARLTRQLLAYAGKDQGISEPVDLGALVRELTPLLTTSVPKIVQVTLDLDPGVPPVDGDPGQLQQVIMNLVINAAEALPERASGVVTIHLARRGLLPEDYRDAVIPIENGAVREYVALSVSDTGSGMDTATQARIFDPFFTTKFDGRGLGLSAVLGIVRGHGGTLTLRSAPGEGTTFRILLPVSRSGARAAAAGKPQALAAAGSGVILVVDDEEAVRKLAQRVLERHGYRVLTASNGRQALDIAAEHREVRAVVLDLAMPVMSGDSAAPELRKLRPDLPLILSSGYAEGEALERFGQDALIGFLQKPYSARTLLEKVAEVLAMR